MQNNNQESYDDDAGYGSEGESYDQVAQQQPVAPQQVADLEHIKSENLIGIQPKRIVFSVRATPSQLARNPALCEVKLSEKQQKELLQVTALKNRHAPDAADISGDLDQIIITELTGVKYVNGAHIPVKCEIEGQVPNTLLAGAADDRTGMLLECTSGMPIVDRQNVFSPKNIMIRDMLEIWECCDDTVLSKEFQALDDIQSGERKCLVYTEGAAANLLAANPAMFDNYYINDVIPGTKMAIVPAKTSKKLYDYMKNTIDDIRTSFVSAKDIKVKFSPEVGSWDDVSNFVGNQTMLQQDKVLEHQQKLLNTPIRVAVHMDMQHITVPKIYKK